MPRFKNTIALCFVCKLYVSARQNCFDLYAYDAATVCVWGGGGCAAAHLATFASGGGADVLPRYLAKTMSDLGRDRHGDLLTGRDRLTETYRYTDM